MNVNLMTRWFVIAMLAAAVSAADQPAASKPAKADAPKAAAKPPPGPKPTLADVAYGTHPKQVLHFWKAESARPRRCCSSSTAAAGWVAIA